MGTWLAEFNPQIHASKSSAFWFLLFVVPISAYVIWYDLKTMKILNKLVILLVLCFVVVGPFVLPLPEYGLRLLQGAAILVLGFFVHVLGGIGAGDVKFIAAASPFVAPDDAYLMLIILAAALPATLVTHGVTRKIPAVRAIAPDWASWAHRDFPMGVALGFSLVAYLALATQFGT